MVAAIYARISIPPKVNPMGVWSCKCGLVNANGTKCSQCGGAEVSRHQQDATNQLDALRAYCKAHDWPIHREYVDQQTGKRGDRKELNALLLDAHQRKFDVVVVWSLDRLTREGALPALTYLNRFSGYGVQFVSLQEPYLDTAGAFKDAVVAILATLARLESLRIGERVKAGQERARREGRPAGRRVVVLDRVAVREKRAEGLSWSELADYFSRKLGRKVSVGTVRRRAK